MTRANDPDVDLSHQVARQETRKVESRRALQRLVGSSVLGSIAAWRLFNYEELPHVEGETHGIPWLLVVWVALALLAFGLANFDQVAKVFKR